MTAHRLLSALLRQAASLTRPCTLLLALASAPAWSATEATAHAEYRDYVVGCPVWMPGCAGTWTRTQDNQVAPLKAEAEVSTFGMSDEPGPLGQPTVDSVGRGKASAEVLQWNVWQQEVRATSWGGIPALARSTTTWSDQLHLDVGASLSPTGSWRLQALLNPEWWGYSTELGRVRRQLWVNGALDASSRPGQALFQSFYDYPADKPLDHSYSGSTAGWVDMGSLSAGRALQVSLSLLTEIDFLLDSPGTLEIHGGSGQRVLGWRLLDENDQPVAMSQWSLSGRDTGHLAGVSAVPEAASLTLWLLGLGGLVAWRRHCAARGRPQVAHR